MGNWLCVVKGDLHQRFKEEKKSVLVGQSSGCNGTHSVGLNHKKVAC